MSKYYTPLQTASLLGLSKNTMYKYIKEGTIRSIRLGAGKIRIPSSEIAKFAEIANDLHPISELAENAESRREKSELEPEATGDNKALEKEIETNIHHSDDKQAVVNTSTKESHITIYDWFVGLSSVMAALGYFLFDYGIGTNGNLSAEWSWAIRGCLFLWGFGHILLSLLAVKRNQLKRLSYGVGGILFAGITAGLLWNSVFRGLSLYAAMAVGLFASSAVLMPNTKRFRLHMLIAIISAFALNLTISLGAGSFFPTVSNIPVGGQLWVTFTLGAMLFLTVISSVVQGSKRRWYLIINHAILLTAIGFVYLAVDYGLWDRAMMLLVWIVFGEMLPYEKLLDWGVGRRRIQTAQWLGMGAVMIISVSVIGGLVTSVRKTYVQEATHNSVEEVRIDVDREVESAQDRLKGIASSRLLQLALNQQKPEISHEYLRDIVRGTTLFNQMLLIDQEGVVVTYYPETSPRLVGSNVAFREYFVQAISGSTYVSESLFQGNIDGLPWIAAVSVPVVDESGQVIGVLAGRLNLNTVAKILQGHATSWKGSGYLLDKSGRVISAYNQGEAQVERVGEKPESIHVGESMGVMPDIAMVAPVSPMVRVPFLSSVKTNCCGWYVVSYAQPTLLNNSLDLLGLALVLGVMVIMAVAVAVMMSIGTSGHKAPEGAS